MYWHWFDIWDRQALFHAEGEVNFLLGHLEMEHKKTHQTFPFHIYPLGLGWAGAFLGQTGWQSAILQSSPDCKLDVQSHNCLKVVAKYVLLLKWCGLFFLPLRIATANYPIRSLVPVAFSTSVFILSLKVAVSCFPCLFPSKITFSTLRETSPHFSLFNHVHLKTFILSCGSISHSMLLQPNIPNFPPYLASSVSQVFSCVSGAVTLLLLWRTSCITGALLGELFTSQHLSFSVNSEYWLQSYLLDPWRPMN